MKFAFVNLLNRMFVGFNTFVRRRTFIELYILFLQDTAFLNSTEFGKAFLCMFSVNIIKTLKF